MYKFLKYFIYIYDIYIMATLEMIMFNKVEYDLDQSKQFLINNNYKYNDVEETKNYYKFRQCEFNANSKYFSKVLSNNIKMILIY